MPFCTACGAEFKQGAKFCGECGVSTNEAVPKSAHRQATNEHTNSLGIGTLTEFSDDASSPQLIFRKTHDAQKIKEVLRKSVRDEKIANIISYREQI